MTDDELLRTLAVLRAQYVAEAPARLAAIRGALEGAARGDRSALGELRQALHKLAGSGGAYGLQSVTDTARAGELAVYQIERREEPPTQDDLDRLAGHVEAVAAAFREAGGQV